MTSTQKEFNVIDKRFNKLDKSINKINAQLKTKVSVNDLNDWEFSKSFETDINALKYVNIDKLKNLPSARKINDTLIKEGLR